MRLWDHPSTRRLRAWSPGIFWILLSIYTIWPWAPWHKARSKPIVFYGFSILGETLNQKVLPAFQRDWKARTGEHVEFATSFAGSGTITNQILMGVPAQLALLSFEPDAERLAAAGLIQPEAWKRFPCGGVVNRTPFVILVRSGNPKGIHGFADLARPGIKIVHPDPLTSGAANWAILAEYGAGIRLYPEDPPKGGYSILMGIWSNVVAQAQSARAARTQFENGFGDALITYEQEALWDRARGQLHSDLVYPSSTILSEHILVKLDKNIDADQMRIVDALIRFLWSDQAQKLFIESGFRSIDDRLNASHGTFGKIEDPFRVSALGGWPRAKRTIIDSIWKNQILKELGRQR